MDDDRPLFILAGNGPYTNRGCEAIVRGTTKILREYFKEPRIICLTHFRSEDEYLKQSLDEIDRSIDHLRTHSMSRKQALLNFWKPETWPFMIQHLSNSAELKYRTYRDMLPYLNDASAILSVGGDNYSLDYGIPKHFIDLDDIVLENNKPLAIWGASIGPFDKIPDYEVFMGHHLRKVTGIFARESATIDYLNEIGVAENVYSTADPAFLMDPSRPEGIEKRFSFDEDTIGINLSPLMAKYVTGGNLGAWARMAGSIINTVAQETEMPIYLIPHVTKPTSNDHLFLQQALSSIVNRNDNITLIPPIYNAAETKWIISQTTLFAGARTHSTIAALSSEVPTLSFAYSIKAQGINRDLFGHTNYCIGAADLDAKTVSCHIASMLDNRAAISNELAERIPNAQRAAMNAGIGLKNLLEES